MPILYIEASQIGPLATTLKEMQAETLKRKRSLTFKQIAIAMKAMRLLPQKASVQCFALGTRSSGESVLLVVHDEVPTSALPPSLPGLG